MSRVTSWPYLLSAILSRFEPFWGFGRVSLFSPWLKMTRFSGDGEPSETSGVRADEPTVMVLTDCGQWVEFLLLLLPQSGVYSNTDKRKFSGSAPDEGRDRKSLV